jgi:hypothetical protein
VSTLNSNKRFNLFRKLCVHWLAENEPNVYRRLYEQASKEVPRHGDGWLSRTGPKLLSDRDTI